MLHIATPVYRREFLEQIYDTIPKENDITWHLAKSKHTDALPISLLQDARIKIYEIDCLDTDTVAKRNAIFEQISDGYFYLLDDDTIFLKEVYTVYADCLQSNFMGMSIGNQKFGAYPKIFQRLNAHSLEIMGKEPDFSVFIIDTGMVISHHSVLRHIKWSSPKHYYNDCYFWSACYAYFGVDNVRLINETISYYNFFGPKYRLRVKKGFFKVNLQVSNPFLTLIVLFFVGLLPKKPRVFVNQFPFDKV